MIAIPGMIRIGDGDADSADTQGKDTNHDTTRGQDTHMKFLSFCRRTENTICLPGSVRDRLPSCSGCPRPVALYHGAAPHRLGSDGRAATRRGQGRDGREPVKRASPASLLRQETAEVGKSLADRVSTTGRSK